MPGSIYDWSKTAGQNDSADGDIDWREGMFPDSVNDSARQMMGRSAEWRDDITGALTPTGTANALLLTANSSFASLANGRMLTFRAGANNTGPVSINVNMLGSKAIRAIGATGDVDLVANDLKAGCPCTIIYSTTANGGSGAWIVVSASRAIGADRVDAFPVGTRLLFQQSAAPTGWTKDATHNDKALRLVSGAVTTGGTVAFAAAFSSARATTAVTQGGTVGGTAVTVAQMPAHQHGPGSLQGPTNTAGAHIHHVSGSTDTRGDHIHGSAGGGQFLVYRGSGGRIQPAWVAGGDTDMTSIATAGAHNHSVSGSTDSQGGHTHTATMNAGTTTAAGSGEAHDHTFTGDPHSHSTDLAVQYVDVIICEKAA